jgi:hypothetical protein
MSDLFMFQNGMTILKCYVLLSIQTSLFLFSNYAMQLYSDY